MLSVQNDGGTAIVGKTIKHLGAGRKGGRSGRYQHLPDLPNCEKKNAGLLMGGVVTRNLIYNISYP